MSETVKLIVKIPKYLHEDLKSGKIYSSLCEAPQGLVEGIRNGTPLDDVKAEINNEISKVRELFDIAYEYNKKDSTRTELSQKCTTYLLDVWQTMGAIVDNIGKGDKV